MTVRNDQSGGRSVELEFELPGTPEQVWDAIATGPGISSWFVPTEVEPRKGGAIVFQLAPGLESRGHVTGWEPPRRFAYEEPGWSGDAPPLGTECTVEARAGGVCTVRIVHSLFTSKDDWDDQLESMEKGWLPFIRVLRIYLAQHAGQRSASTRSTVQVSGPHQDAWSTLVRLLGVADAAVGETRDTSVNGAPRLVGTVERVSESAANCEVLLRVREPGPGVAVIGTYVWDEAANVAVSLFFYGEGCDALMARESPRWTAWLNEHFSQAATAAAPER